MAKDPAFLLYSSDFLTGTYTMTDEQVGKYIRLLCLQHQKGSLTEDDMQKICGKYDGSIYDKFQKNGTEYINQRLKDEAQKRKAYCDSRRTNRMKKPVQQETYDEHMSPHMENENENEDEVDIVQSVFSNISNSSKLKSSWEEWKEYKSAHFKFKYKTRKSEIIALKNLQTISNDKEDSAIAIINQSITNGWKGLFTIKSDTTTKSRSQQRFDQRIEYANRHNS